MTPEGFARQLDRHGPRPGHWPPALQAEAEALLAASAAARAALREAMALDAALQDTLPEPAPEAVARLRASVARRIARAPLPAPAGPWQRLRQALRPAAPAGWGALVAIGSCALWLALAPPAPAPDGPLAPLLALPVAGEAL